MGKFGETGGGWGKVACWSTKAAISLKRVRGKVTVDGLYELTNVLSNGTIPDPLRPPLPQDWDSQPQPKTSIAITSGTGKDTDFKFVRYIQRVHPYKIPLKILQKRGVWAYPGTAQIF